MLKHVLSLDTETEIGALFINAKKANVYRTTLQEIGHLLPPTPIQTDNKTACDLANNKLKKNRTRTIDMRFYWVRDRVKQGHFTINWKPGSMNLADYYTKHHPTSHHRRIRP